VGVAPDGKWLVSVGDDARVIVRPTDNLQQSTTAQPREGGLMCLAFSKSGQHVYAAGNLADFGRTTEMDGAIRVALESGTADGFVEFPVEGTIERMALVNDDTRFIYFCASNELLTLKVGAKNFARRSRIYGGFTDATAISSDGQHFAVTSQNERNNMDAEPRRLTVLTANGVQTLSYTFPSKREFAGAQICFVTDETLVLCMASGKLLRWTWEPNSRKWNADGELTVSEAGPYSAIAAQGAEIHLARDRTLLTIDAKSGAVRQKVELQVGDNSGGIASDPVECLKTIETQSIIIAGLQDGRLAVVPLPAP
jgi:hypothetical protein